MNYKIFDYAFLKSLAEKSVYACYVYDGQLFRDTIKSAKDSCKKHFGNKGFIHYALKANSNPEILEIVRESGLGLDCVSGGEILKAYNYDFEPSQIVFAGVGKEDDELSEAIYEEVFSINCESCEEIEIINRMAMRMKMVASIMVRINPDIDAKTHKYISTGNAHNKFGISFSDLISFLPKFRSLKNVKLLGLHYHIGSQITDMQVFRDLANLVSEQFAFINKTIPLKHLDLGGGLGIDYDNPKETPIPDFDSYFAAFKGNLQVPKTTKLHFELGRSLVGQCGAILTKVLFIKSAADNNFAVINAGMNDLIRPALYGAKHNIILLRDTEEAMIEDEIKSYDIVGPVCESADVFATNLRLPRLSRGDFFAIQSCGAYAISMASEYNSRALLDEVLI